MQELFHTGSGIRTDEITVKRSRIIGSVETTIFQQIANHLLSEGKVPVPPLRFAMVLYYLLWNYRSRGDATAAGLRHYVP